MWPLSIALLLAMNAAPQQAPAPQGSFIGKIPQLVQLHRKGTNARRLSPEEARNRNLCYTIRSYHFRRQDGLAPVPAGVTTCTPASTLQQKQVSPAPHVQFVPMVMPQESEGEPAK